MDLNQGIRGGLSLFTEGQQFTQSHSRSFGSHDTVQHSGSIYGAFIGDAAGAFVEFQLHINENEVNEAMKLNGGGTFNTGPGQITDDSEMAVSLFRGLGNSIIIQNDFIVNGSGLQDLDQIAQNYLDWAHSNPFDIGMTTRTALSPLTQNVEGIYQQVQKRTLYSQSNGTLMRITPLAVWGSQLNSIDDLYRAVHFEGQMTHCDKIVIDTAFLYCYAIRLALNGESDRKVIFETIRDEAKKRQLKLVDEWLNEAQNDFFPNPCQKGYDHQSALRKMIIEGGDTDTNAAIVGGLIGACQGAQNLNQDQIQKYYET
ncbi:UNKNOWN [Stylonychia lemnae]|uniref:ADP-ribosylglycohydrolase n=1 Tax=Stylonychia lemnae TaxID=5949 RepID=A0A078B185_STYLE|nr:UNKNOWN [Stylonychia lemnae]|eukprot:CDW86878.1 UNKNOWN [Stylonychia lemnae]